MGEKYEESAKDVIVNDNKKQKTGLGAIRPDDDTKERFNVLCSANNLSQTKMFEAMLWSYINGQNGEEKECILPLDSEVNLIAVNLENILKHFKNIVDVAQDTLSSERNKNDNDINNLKRDKETLENVNQELKDQLNKLKESNENISILKDKYQEEIANFKHVVQEKDTEVQELKNENLELMKQNKMLKELESKFNDLDTENEKSKVKILEDDNKIKKMEKVIEDYRNEINEVKLLQREELSKLEKNLSMKYESEKNNSIADMKLELVDIKINLNEKMILIQELNNKIKEYDSDKCK